MKKLRTLTIVFAMACCIAACGNTTTMDEVSSETMKETVIIQALDANREVIDVEVPFNPQRIAVLDMAALDLVDALGMGDRIVGSAKVTIEYLTQYNPDDSNGEIMNLGTVKTADLEKVAACEPDVIFIGGRLSSVYADLEAIAPVVCLGIDYEKGIVESTKANAQTVASIFGKEETVDATQFMKKVHTVFQYYNELVKTQPLNNKLLVLSSIAIYSYKRLKELVKHNRGCSI